VILLIDNYDSFTWNLVQRLGEINPALEVGRDLLVVRNDQITPEAAAALDGGRGPERVIISPGPCTPKGRVFRRGSSSGSRGGYRCWACVWGTRPWRI
jgi:anthranilate/para-aminobenzoate synthase component II